ncbi:putative peptide zinc metalloprotease protein [Lysinibacillus parviboronicapiens]|uniref:Peptide zinc metalloprotease protein n=1 Tax=Lysinibacillus parviboronicapiens TaxID=436516 RepID=A0ABV2PE89_9BACI
MSEMKISGDTIVEVHNIETYQSNDNDSITIRRIGTSDYLLFDVNTLNLYNSFSSNKSIAELALINSDHDYQIEDIIEFVDVLLDAGFIKTIDGQKISESLTDNPNLNVEPSKFYSLIFGKVAWTIYIFSMFANLYLFFTFETLRPKGSDFFVSNSGIISILIIIISTWIVIFFHEYGHICAAKSVGIGAKVKWGYRLVFLVLETEVADIWSVSRRKRYGIYLAGIAWTSILILFCALMQFYFFNEFVIKILKFAILMQLQTIVFQTLLFLRTDLYYVLINFLKIDDLNESMKYIFKNVLTLQFHNVSTKLNNLSAKERKVVKIYSVCSLIGILVSLYLFFVIDIPIALYSVKQTLEKTLRDPLFSISYWDGIAMGTLTLCPIVILIVYVLIDLRKRTVKGNI